MSSAVIVFNGSVQLPLYDFYLLPEEQTRWTGYGSYDAIIAFKDTQKATSFSSFITITNGVDINGENANTTIELVPSSNGNLAGPTVGAFLESIEISK